MLGRHVLDVGSGSGACAIAAMKSGALSVTANDIDPGILKHSFVKYIVFYVESKMIAVYNTVKRGYFAP
jgi:predicted nicotinamide N-methyase